MARHGLAQQIMADLIIRFLLGGLVVSSFAVLGDVLKPKSFAGLFSAAPSVALASLGLAASRYGKDYASVEGKAMMAGAAAFIIYAWLVSQLLFRTRFSVLLTTLACVAVWFVGALVFWSILAR